MEDDFPCNGVGLERRIDEEWFRASRVALFRIELDSSRVGIFFLIPRYTSPRMSVVDREVCSRLDCRSSLSTVSESEAHELLSSLPPANREVSPLVDMAGRLHRSEDPVLRSSQGLLSSEVRRGGDQSVRDISEQEAYGARLRDRESLLA